MDQKTERHEGRLNILQREICTELASVIHPIVSKKKKMVITTIEINGYSARVFGNVSKRYQNKEVVLEETERCENGVGVLEDKIYSAGIFHRPILHSEVKYNAIYQDNLSLCSSP